MRIRFLLPLVVLLCVLCSAIASAQPVPDANENKIEQLNAMIESQEQQLVSAYSTRGDLHFFAGNFQEAVRDYEAMVTLRPGVGTSHWRRGIAWFYAGEYKKAAHQFEIYHTFDNVDRENGIWRYFSQYKAYGPKKAAAGLLKYEKDDRQPFPDVYQLFAGKLTADQILQKINEAKITPNEREKRLFYAELYIGLNYALIGEEKKAKVHLKRSSENKWGPAAGYGPHYMWEVGRVHLKLLEQKKPAKPDEQ